MHIVTGAQIRAARALIRWTARNLAEAAEIDVTTVSRAEVGNEIPSVTSANLRAIRLALEAAGIDFIPNNGGGVGVRFKYARRHAQQNSPSHGDITGIQCKLARVALDWGVLDLAKAANVSTQTITRLERGEQLRVTTLENIKRVLEEAGIEFIPRNGGGVGVRFREPT